MWRTSSCVGQGQEDYQILGEEHLPRRAKDVDRTRYLSLDSRMNGGVFACSTTIRHQHDQPLLRQIIGFRIRSGTCRWRRGSRDLYGRTS